MADAVNAALVCAGARCAARLDQGYEYRRNVASPRRSAFIESVKAFERGVIGVVSWGRPAGPRADPEPLVVNLRCLRAANVDLRDVDAVRANVGSDLEPGISGALGRLLGYPCRYDKEGGWDRMGTLSLYAHVHAIDVKTARVTRRERLWLAGFGCGRDVSQKEMRSHVVAAHTRWVAPCSRALAGAVVDLDDRTKLVIDGFDIVFAPRRGVKVA